MPLIPPPAELHNLLSGRTRGVRAALTRAGLAALEPFYYLGSAYRNWRYDRDPSRTTKVEIPVVSVGNLTVGGAGKTPVVLWIAQRLREQELRVAILSRGYGADASRNDEAMELEQRLPDVPHIQHADRVAGAQIAIEELESQTLVLDDAFQHRRIARDLDVVLLDALCPFGYGHLLPRGLLRESLRGLRRAQIVILTRSDLVAPSQRKAIETQARRYHPDLLWAEASHSPSALWNASGARRDVTELANRRVAAFCGIGNPEGFRQTLERCGAEVVGFRAFPDHHRYSAEDVDSLTTWAAELGVEVVICTSKDLVKLQIDALGAVPLYAFEIAIEFHSGEEHLRLALAEIANQAWAARPE